MNSTKLALCLQSTINKPIITGKQIKNERERKSLDVKCVYLYLYGHSEIDFLIESGNVNY